MWSGCLDVPAFLLLSRNRNQGCEGIYGECASKTPQGSKAGNQKQVPNGLYSTLPFYKYTSRHISYYFIHSFKKHLLSIYYGIKHNQESRFLRSWGPEQMGPTRVTQVFCGGRGDRSQSANAQGMGNMGNSGDSCGWDRKRFQRS